MLTDNQLHLTSTRNSFSINNSPINKLEEWFFAVLIFIFSTPVFIWDQENILTISYGIFILLSLKYVFKTKNKSAILYPLILAYSYLMLRYILIIGGSFLGFLVLALSFLAFVVLDPPMWRRIFNKYILIFSITIIPSIVQFLLVSVAQINFNYTMIDASPYNPHEGLQFLRYAFFVTPQGTDFGIISRFCGFYDEPGVIGTIAMAILYTNKYNIKKWYNITVLIAGILSFSLFFYLASIFFIFLNRNIFKTISFAIALSVIFSLLGSFEVLNQYFYSRVESVVFKGKGIESRENDAFQRFYNTLQITDKLFGVPLGTTVVFSTTYKVIFAICGIIPFTIYFLFLFVFSKKKLGNGMELLIYISIVLLIFAQRPFINSKFYIFLTIVPLYSLMFTKDRKENMQINENRFSS